MSASKRADELRTFLDERIVQRLASSVSRMDARQKVLSLLLITLLIYGPAIAYYLSDPSVQYDFDIYRSRTQTIIDGGCLYRDVHTETPPLINYIMVPAQLLGGAQSAYVWGAYEAFFAFLLAVMLYLSFRKFDEMKAFGMGVLTILSPYLIIESATGEDAAIVAFVFFLGAVLMVLDKRYAVLAIALGAWTKMWPVLMMPVEFLRSRGFKKKTEVILLAALITVAITAPFLFLCSDKFLEFISFYFIGDPSRPSGGRSLWNFLRDGGYGLPAIVELALVIGSLLIAYLYSHFKNWGAWRSVTLAMLVFIVFYPKMHMGYYVMPFVLLAAWSVSDWKIAARLFLAYIPITYSGGFASDNPDPILAAADGGWIIGLLLVILALMLICDAARMAFRSPAFLETAKTSDGQTELT
ncbi:MAG TPA: hypothetical protein PLC39_05405 [Methanomassiliicoccales archaeon]|nr:hypothetical protein [Methanomassiliicoccales archaeon]